MRILTPEQRPVRLTDLQALARSEGWWCADEPQRIDGLVGVWHVRCPDCGGIENEPVVGDYYEEPEAAVQTVS